MCLFPCQNDSNWQQTFLSCQFPLCMSDISCVPPCLHMFPPSCHLPSSDLSFVPSFPVCPLVPSTLPLLAVCYSCWSNLENVPNPLSVLLPQRNTKWIRQDYNLPLPPPPYRPPLPPPPLLLCAVTLFSSSHFPYLSIYMSIFLWTFLLSSAGLKPPPSPDDKLVPPVDRCSCRPSASWPKKYR